LLRTGYTIEFISARRTYREPVLCMPRIEPGVDFALIYPPAWRCSCIPEAGAVDEQLVTGLLPLLARKPQEEFNVFNVMRYGGHEKQLSDIVGWLLDAEGTHNLGDAFVRILIDEVNREIGDAEPVGHGSYGVRQEVNTTEAGDAGDIADLILEDDKTVLVIENYYTSSGHGHSYDGYLSFASAKARGVWSCCSVSRRTLRSRSTDGRRPPSSLTRASYRDW
jgi:hypothetical protein